MLLQRAGLDREAALQRKRGDFSAALLGIVAILVVTGAGMVDDGRTIPVTAVILGPLLTGMLATPRATVGVGLVAVAAAIVLGEADDLSATAEMPSRVAVVLAGGASAALVSSVRMRRDRELAALEQAHDSTVRAMFAESAVAMMLVDADGTVVDLNDAMCGLVGRARDDLMGTPAGEGVHPDDLDLAAHERVLSGEAEHWQGDLRLRDDELGWRWVRVTASVISRAEQSGSAALVQVIDINADKQAEAELQDVLSTLREAVVVLDEHGAVHALNQATEDLYGLPADRDFVGGPLPPVVLERLTDETGELLGTDVVGSALVPPGEGSTGRILGYRHPDGGQRWYSLSARELRVRGQRRILVSTIDVTDRYDAERALAHRVRHDPLTGLANRVELHDLITKAAGAASSGLGIVFVDLDHFKAINDSAGHDVGDQVLVHVADRLRAAVRPGDTVCRYAGDEFIVVCPDCPDPGDLGRIAERLAASIGEPTETRAGVIRPGASLGAFHVAVPTTTSAEQLLRQADSALYEAKANGRGLHVVRTA